MPDPIATAAGGVLDAVRGAFPRLTWSRAEFPEQGLDHHVAVLLDPAGIPLDDGHPIVARLATAAGVVGRADVEAGILEALAPASPAALPVAHATDGDSLTLARHIPGAPLDGRLWRRLDDGARAIAAHELAAALDGLHALPIDSPAVVPVGESWFPVKHAALTEAVATHLLPVLDPRDAAGVREIMATAAETFIDDPVAPRLIHGDLHETHLRWNGDHDGGVGIIDFSDMTLADPAIDVAHLAGISPQFHARVISDLAAADGDLERRAAIYSRWDAVFLMADHLTTGRTPETTARALLGRALESLAG